MTKQEATAIALYLSNENARDIALDRTFPAEHYDFESAKKGCTKMEFAQNSKSVSVFRKHTDGSVSIAVSEKCGWFNQTTRLQSFTIWRQGEKLAPATFVV